VEIVSRPSPCVRPSGAALASVAVSMILATSCRRDPVPSDEGLPSAAAAAASARPVAPAARPTPSRWPTGIVVCGLRLHDSNALGYAVSWRSLSFTVGRDVVSEWSRDVEATADSLGAAGFDPAVGGAHASFTRTEPERELTATLHPLRSFKLQTSCVADPQARTTTMMTDAGWITPHEHRRIGRGPLQSLTVSDGDERYERAELSSVDEPPDTRGLVSAAKGAYHHQPGAEPEALLVLTAEPLLVEYRKGNAETVRSALEQHANHAP
jgi:hypothetical protein